MDSSPAPPDGLAAGDRLRKEGQLPGAVEAYLAAASALETPPAALCLRLARCYRSLGEEAEALRWAAAVVDAGDDFAAWHAAATLVQKCGSAAPHLRAARVALLGSYTTAQLGPLLRLAALRRGVALEVHEAAYGQYRQEILDPESATYAFGPDFVLLAVHEGEVALPDHSDAPAEQVEAELRRWTGLWEAVARRSAARVVQHNFAIPPEVPLGHLAARLPGSRYRMTQALNHRLGDEAGSAVTIVDCDRLASYVGKQRWFDPRYWHHAKQAVALDALPLLARHTAAVLAAELGMTRKCLVLDLDNTLWGGVIGEDGLAGIRLGGDAEGEAYAAFQEYVSRLKDRGVILAVCSKNDEAVAREPFEKHPAMRIRLEDVPAFVANWESKADGIRAIARTLNIGLDAVTFVDDNPAERQVIRRFLPEVDVVPLPADPAGYARSLSEYVGFEAASLTAEDRERAAQYRARARLASLEASADSLEDFHRSLRMEAVVQPFNAFDLPRIAQLIAKSNQFNLTTRRHGPAQLQRFMADPACVHFSLRLRDCFADHGLVGVMVAFRRGGVLDVDTWLMSCRVIGRTVEAEMLGQLCRRAAELGCTSLRGTYVPTAKNAMVKDVFARFGFELLEDTGGTTTWRYDLPARGAIENGFISVVEPGREAAAPDARIPA
ncbi:MAG TPA: HAD-IIIC family phosphatase [Longimicrobiaceae bacterium]|nr:HAD-IIIC family phosphatase [Longimicrobiaceae bacterium]